MSSSSKVQAAACPYVNSKLCKMVDAVKAKRVICSGKFNVYLNDKESSGLWSAMGLESTLRQFHQHDESENICDVTIA